MTGYQSKKAAAQDKLDNMEREALKLALEALENHEGNYKLNDAGCDRQEAAVTAIKEALAQPASSATSANAAEGAQKTSTLAHHHRRKTDETKSPKNQAVIAPIPRRLDSKRNI